MNEDSCMLPNSDIQTQAHLADLEVLAESAAKLGQNQSNQSPTATSNSTLMDEEKQRICKDEVVQKLFNDLGFGSTDTYFKYKLTLEDSFPSKLYKNRKFGLAFKLVPCTARSSKLVLNSKFVFMKAICWIYALQSLTRMAIGSMRTLSASPSWTETLNVTYIRGRASSPDSS